MTAFAGYPPSFKCIECKKEKIGFGYYKNSYERKKGKICLSCYLKLGKHNLTPEDIEDIR